MENLILVNNYIPSFKSGGPVRSIYNLHNALGEEFDFNVICNDRDAGDEVPFEEITVGKPLLIDKKYKVTYMPPNLIEWFKSFNLIIEKKKYSIVYVNSVFNFRYSIYPLFMYVLGFIDCRNFLIAPRGELMDGAISISSRRKSLYLSLLKLILRLSKKNIAFHATSEEELLGLKKQLKISGELIFKAQNLPSVKKFFENKIKIFTADNIKLIYISRVTEKKNILYFINYLAGLSFDGSLTLDIYGPASGKDQEYLSKCLSIKLPQNITVNYLGSIDNSIVSQTLLDYDFFILPTKGENFGHAIAEALIAGVPVLTTKNTPYYDIEDFDAGVLCDINKNNDILKSILEFKTKYPQVPCESVKTYSTIKFQSNDEISKYRAFFEKYNQ